MKGKETRLVKQATWEMRISIANTGSLRKQEFGISCNHLPREVFRVPFFLQESSNLLGGQVKIHCCIGICFHMEAIQ